MLEEAGFTIVACERMALSRPVAEGFYAVHKARPFFGELVEFMTRSPVFVCVLEREDAVAKYRAGHGRDRSGEGRRRHDPQGSRHATSARTPSTAPTRSRTRASRSRYFFAASKVAPVAG